MLNSIYICLFLWFASTVKFHDFAIQDVKYNTTSH